MASEAELKAALGEKEAELATLQNSFDEYIESSKELESELESELAKVEEQVGVELRTGRASASNKGKDRNLPPTPTFNPPPSSSPHLSRKTRSS